MLDTNPIDNPPNLGAEDRSLATAGEEMVRSQETLKLFQTLLKNQLTTNSMKHYEARLKNDLKSGLNLNMERISIGRKVMRIKTRDAKRKMRKDEKKYLEEKKKLAERSRRKHQTTILNKVLEKKSTSRTKRKLKQ